MVIVCERCSPGQRCRQQTDEESHLEFPTLVTLRNHGTDNLGRAPVTGLALRVRSGPIRGAALPAGRFFFPSLSACRFRIFVLLFLFVSFRLSSPSSFSSLSTGLRPRCLPLLWDDVDVFSKASLVSAFCRDRRGL